MTWIFNEPGCIPGVAGQFAGCQVDINGDGTLDIRPLAQQPHITDAPTADTTATASEETTEAATPENEEVD